MKRKEAIREALQIAGNTNYKNWLKNLAETDKKLVWFGAIRSVAFAYKAGDAAVESAQEVGKGVVSRMRTVDPDIVRKKVAAAFESVQALLPPEEQAWWNEVLVSRIRKMSLDFFDPTKEFIANWQQDKLEWEAEIRRLKREEGNGRQGPRLFKSKEELLKDLSTLMGYWNQRNAQFQRVFDAKGIKEATEWNYAHHQPPGVFFDSRLDEGMKSFLAQIGDAQCLLESDTNWNSRRLRDLVIFGSAAGMDQGNVIYVNSVFEQRAKEFINLLHGAS